MSFFDIDLGTVGLNDLTNQTQVNQSISINHPSYDPNNVTSSVGVTEGEYTTSYTTTAQSEYIKEVSADYSANALVYLYGIKPIKPTLLEYAILKVATNIKQGQVLNNVNIHDELFIPNNSGYTNDITESQDYKNIMGNLKMIGSTYNSGNISDGVMLASVAYNLLKLIGLSKQSYYEIEDGIKEDDSLATKIKKYREKDNSFLGKMEDFLLKKGFRFSTNFKFNNDRKITVQNNEDIFNNLTTLANNLRIQSNQPAVPKFIDFDMSIDTYDYMAGGSMYSSIREPLVIGQKPISNLENESLVFGATELLEKRFNLLRLQENSIEDNVKGLSLYRAIDLKNKTKYLADAVSYNQAVEDINKTNEMLAIFADKLEYLAMANIYAYMFSYYRQGDWFYCCTDFVATMENTIPIIQNMQDIDWDNDTTEIIQGKIYNNLKVLTYNSKYSTWYKNPYGVYAPIVESYNYSYANSYATNVVSYGIGQIVSATQAYQDELLVWASYMDSTYGIEV